VRELRVDMFSTVDGYGGPGPRSAPYWGYGAPGLYEWVNGQLAEEHVMLMGANTYRQMSEIVADGDDPSFPRMAQLPKIVFSKTLKPPLTWANTTVIDEPLETAVPALKARPTACRCGPSAAGPSFEACSGSAWSTGSASWSSR
jgi:hypothetical protein